MSIESVMPSNHLILCRPLLFLPSIFPSIWVFLMSQLFTSGGQSFGATLCSTYHVPVSQLIGKDSDWERFKAGGEGDDRG